MSDYEKLKERYTSLVGSTNKLEKENKRLKRTIDYLENSILEKNDKIGLLKAQLKEKERMLVEFGYLISVGLEHDRSNCEHKGRD